MEKKKIKLKELELQKLIIINAMNIKFSLKEQALCWGWTNFS